MARFSAKSSLWDAKRKEVLADATVCYICWGELDFDAPARSRWSPSVDHIVPLSKVDAETRRWLILDDANLRPVHYGCNSRRGNRASEPRRAVSRSW